MEILLTILTLINKIDKIAIKLSKPLNEKKSSKSR